MAQLSVDTEGLIMALDDHSYDLNHFLDRETGEIVQVSHGAVLGDDKELEEAWETDPERFEAIDPLPSSTAYEVMANFTETQAPARARLMLMEALEGRHPFRAFKDALFNFPDLRQQWFQHRDAVYKQLAAEWLLEHDIEAPLRPLAGETPL